MTILERLEEKILAIDMFGRNFRFQLPGNKDTHNTRVGALVSTFMIFIMVFYSITMLEQLLLFEGTTVTESARERHFETWTLFPTEIPDLYSGKFNIAFGLTEYNGSPDNIDDAKYG